MAMPDLSQMSQADAIAALRQYYANAGQFNPMDPYAGTGFSGDPQYARDVAPSYGNDKISGLQPNANGGFSGALTPSFDPLTAGGQYGSYSGSFDAQGNLDPNSVQFGQDQRHNGWISENMPLVTALAVGGSMLGAGAFGAGAGGSSAALSPELMQTGYLGFSPEAAAVGGGAAGTMADLSPELTQSAYTGFTPDAATMASGTGSASQVGMPSSIADFSPELTQTAYQGAGIAPAVTGGGLGSGVMNALGGAKGIAALAGGVAGALGGGPTESTTSRNVPEWAQQYGPDIVQRGQDIANQPFQPYTGQRYAGPNDATKQSWEMANQFANAGPSAAHQVSQGTFNRLQSGAVPDFGKATQVDNQYIGQTTPGATNQYIGANTNSNVSALLGKDSNPYLNQSIGSIGPLGQMNLAQTTTDVGRNALLGQNNPYLNDAIGYASDDITRNFQNTVNPQLDRMARASGSFGNSGVEQARAEAQRNLATELGRATTGMRMQDYNLQAQLGEGDLGRRLQAGLTDASRNLGASQAMQQFNIGNDLTRQQSNMGYRAADLTRNMSGFDAAQNRMLDAGKFDASNAQQNWQTNLGATSNLNQFNASLAQGDLARNAQLTGQQQQFNANQGNFDITGARNDWNSAEGRAAQTMNAYQGYDQSAVNRAALLGTTGAEMNRYAQQPLDFQNQEFMRQQDDPYRRLGAYQGAYNTGVNGQSVQSTPTGGNTVAQTLGGAATGIGLWNMFNQPQQQQTGFNFDPLTGRRYA